MFEWLTVEAILEQARPLIAWLMEYQAQVRADAWRELWSVDLWWFKLMLVTYVAIRTYEYVKRRLSRAGVRI